MTEIEAALWLPPPSQEEPQQHALAAMRAVPLLADLSERQLGKVFRLMHERVYEPGEKVFREGDVGAGVYIITSGSVNIVIRVAEGSEKVIASLHNGQFFGEMALLEEVPRSATCVATEKTHLLGFFEPDLELLIDRDARLGSKILRNLARLMAARVRAMNESVRSESKKAAS